MNATATQSLASPRAHAEAATTSTAHTPAGEAASVHRPRLLGAIDLCAEGLVVIALTVQLALVLANVLARSWFQHSFLWSDETARLSLSLLAFIGGAVAYRRRDHAFVRIILSFYPRRSSGTAWSYLRSSFSLSSVSRELHRLNSSLPVGASARPSCSFRPA
jgi:hypothetical protein